MDTIPKGFYRHYKGNYYYVLGICQHTETQEKLVTYISLYETTRDNKFYPFGSMFVRPISMWNEDVNGQPRFIREDPNFELMQIAINYIKTQF